MALRTQFIPALLVADKTISDDFRLLLAHGVKHGGLVTLLMLIHDSIKHTLK